MLPTRDVSDHGAAAGEQKEPRGTQPTLFPLSRSHLRGGDQSKSFLHLFQFEANPCHYFTAGWTFLCNMLPRSLSLSVLTPQQIHQEKGFSTLDEDLFPQLSSIQI